MNKIVPNVVATLLLLVLLISISVGQENSAKIPDIKIDKVIDGLRRPVHLTYAGGGSGRLFIVEQAGQIRIYDKSKKELLEAPFLNIRQKVATSGNEMGLLSIAFHPDFKKNRRFFVYYTITEGRDIYTITSEWKATSDLTKEEADSEKVLLKISKPQKNHNGGQLVFGPDGYLYIGTGDGGGANDPRNNSQNLNMLLGKILRIDVDKKDGELGYTIPKDNPFTNRKDARGELWAYGMRNPWRFSFDRKTGNLWVGDVGQNDREEIDIIKKGKNYGWRIMEGTICTPAVNPNCDKEGLELPIWEYKVPSEGRSIIGGFVYRGKSITGLEGAYIFGDYYSHKVWALRYDGTKVAQHRLLLETELSISSFGEDEDGELYIIDHTGSIYKIAPKKD